MTAPARTTRKEAIASGGRWRSPILAAMKLTAQTTTRIAMAAAIAGRPAIAAAIAILVVAWAVNFIAAKIGLRHLPPLAMASFRVVLAGAVMVPGYFRVLRLSGSGKRG